jgi:Zn-dependent protease/predicted transcriptional regulator
MFESSMRLGAVAGIRIGLHYTWFVIFLMLSFSLTALFQAEHEDWGLRLALATALATALLFFGSIVLHELGHSLVAIRRGVPVRDITLFIFGGVAQTEKDADSAASEFLIAIAGPLVSVALAALFYALYLLAAPWSEAAATACAWLAQINLMVALFNLLPGFPLDGGRVFRALVWGFTGDARKGMRWALYGGKALAYGLMFLGLLVVIQTGLVFNGLWLAAIGWFLLTAAEGSERSFALERLLGRLRAGEVMERAVPTVGPRLTVQAWVDGQVLTSGRRAFLVVEDGRTLGLVTLADAGRLARERWAETAIAEIMTPAERLRTVAPDAPIAEVLRLMQSHGYNQVPVASDGQVRGWIDRLQLLRLIELRAEIGR